jgi:hypothetical protein
LNKKLQKGLTTTMAAAMAMSVAIPATTALAAPATANGWSYSQGTWYYFSNGKKVTNSWKQDSSKQWFFLGANGAMVKNAWKQDSSKNWFFLGADGAMVANKWAQDSSKKWFYLGTDGAMVVNTVTPDGYTVGADGAWDGKPANTTPVTPVTLAVSSVSAIAANSVEVTFNQAPTDTSKVVFAVTNTGTPVATTVAWNAANTIATLTASSNLPEGTYTVDTTNDGTDLGSTSVAFTAQRVAKIAIDSSILAVVGSGTTGYVGYHVYDQYGADITSTYLASTGYINWSCGIGQVTSNNKGLLTVAPFGTTSVLTQYPTCVITAVTENQTIPTSTSATLNISASQGTLSDISLNKLTNADNATPTVGDSETYYIDYSALDMSGNPTTNLDLVQKGIISSTTPGYTLMTSNSDLVSATVVQDPSDSNKAAIQVTIKDPSYTLMQDQPVTITATTYTGKTSSLTFTVKRSQTVNSFTMTAPSTYVASDETVTIPFTAYDQSGNAITKYSELTGITFSSDALKFVENADGTASLQYTAIPNTTTTPIQQTLTATVAASGKFSTMNINVEPQVQVDGLTLDSSVVIPRMEIGAAQSFDFGWNDGGFNVVDQYGRNIDMTSGYKIGDYYYFVEATQDSTGNVTVDPSNNIAYAGHQIKLNAKTAGSSTITFTVMQSKNADLSAATSTGYSQTQGFTVMADKDITGYTLDANTNPYLATAPVGSNATLDTATAQEEDTNDVTELTAYGTNAAGSKVVLNVANIVARTSSSGDFYVLPDGTSTQIVANKFTDSTTTGSSSTIGVSVLNSYDNRVHAATSAITSSTAGQVAKSMGYTAYTVDRNDNTNATGITTSGNTVTVSLAGTQSYFGTTGKTADSTNFDTLNSALTTKVANNSILNAIVGRQITRFDGINTLTLGSSANRGYISLWAKDQYGSKDMNLSYVSVVETGNGTTADASTSRFASVSTDGTLQFSRMPVAGDYVVLSGVSSNGLVETVKIVFAN